MKNKIIFVSVVLALLLCMVGCSTSTVLYGKWADNQGSTIEMKKDGTFKADIKINGVGGDAMEGTFATKAGTNTINFYVSDGRILLSSYDISGAILTLTWTPKKGQNTVLFLMRTDEDKK